jgi:predicted SAM-dependent methyltransferase
MRSYPRLVEVENMRGSANKIHLGCGDIILDTWDNIDLYVNHPKVFNFPLQRIHIDKTYSIAYSCHALEHVGQTHGKEFLKEWHRILKPGGILYLCIPDVAGICAKFSDNPDWMIHCLYGLQTNEGHYHKWGYTEKSIRWSLLEIGFETTFLEKMSYGNTPSMWVEARK